MRILANTNFQYLKQNNNIEILSSKKGKPTLKINGIFIHSKYDPEKEAVKTTLIPNPENTSFIFILGMGLGYHIKQALKIMKNKECKIFIFEENLELVKKCLDEGYINFINNENVLLFAGNDAFMSFKKFISSIELHTIKGYRIIELKPCVKASPEYYKTITARVKDEISFLLMNAFTKLEMQRLWIENIIENSARAFKSVLKLPDSKPDCPAVIIAAGPCLYNYLDIISKIKNNAVLFCVDTALGTLIDAGIMPDYVVSLDSQIHNYKDFYLAGNTGKKLTVLGAMSFYPGINKVTDNVYYFTGLKQNSLIKTLEKITDSQITQIDVDVSVTSAAINIALKSGFEKICFFGLDMAYTYNMTHVQSSPIYNNFLHNSNKFETLDSSFHKIINKRKTYLENGLKVDVNTQVFKTNLEDLIKNSDVDFYNTGNGLMIENAVNFKRHEILEWFERYNKKVTLDCNSYNAEGLLSFFKGLTLALDNFQQNLFNYNNNLHDILGSKNLLENEYGFVKDYFIQDDLYLKRSKTQDTEQKNTFYVLSLINRVKKLQKSVKRAIMSLKSSNDTDVD